MEPGTLSTFLKMRRDLGLHRPAAGVFLRRGQIPITQRHGFHGSRQHAVAFEAVRAHRDHCRRHDGDHDQRQHRPECRRDFCIGSCCHAGQHDLADFAGLGDWVIPVAWGIALLTGVALGAINGLIVWKTGVDAFIVTLGAMLGYRGLVFMYNGEQPTSHLNWTLVDFAEAQFLGLPTAAWFLLGTVAVVWFIMNRTVHGRNAYAIGDNREAAVNAGIRVGPHFLINFMLIGFLAALSAVVFYSESGSVNPNDGQLYELWAITAVVLGGTKLTGGSGSIISTLGGVIAIQLLRKGLGHIGADTETVNLVIGLILIAVLFLDRQLNLKGKQELRV
jgi:ribose transport system permease protein